MCIYMYMYICHCCEIKMFHTQYFFYTTFTPVLALSPAELVVTLLYNKGGGRKSNFWTLVKMYKYFKYINFTKL